MKREELLQLQMQLFYCANAESDKERIQKEIIPTLVKNSNLRASGSGFIERDDDMMRDILGTEDSDAEIEKLEKTMSQMMDMQKTGIDIYYGGFSQMKRFRFFYQLSNWFCPFNSEHPELRALADKLRGSNFLDTLLQNGPFCDSDKYSFAFAMASVFDRLPANVRNMVGNGEALGATRRDSVRVPPMCGEHICRIFTASSTSIRIVAISTILSALRMMPLLHSSLQMNSFRMQDCRKNGSV